MKRFSGKLAGPRHRLILLGLSMVGTVIILKPAPMAAGRYQVFALDKVLKMAGASNAWTIFRLAGIRIPVVNMSIRHLMGIHVARV